jgi:hypothetical protein
MPVIRFIEGTPAQLNGAHAEISGHENAEYLELTRAKLAEHAVLAFATDYVKARPASVYQGYRHTETTHYVDQEAVIDTAEESLQKVRGITNLVSAINKINPKRISPKVLETIVGIKLQTDESGISLVDANNQRFGYNADGSLDVEEVTFEEAVRDCEDRKSDTYRQKLEIARLIAKDGYGYSGRTVQPGKTAESDKYEYGNFTNHISLGHIGENGEGYIPFVTVLAEPFKSDGTMKFGRDVIQEQARPSIEDVRSAAAIGKLATSATAEGAEVNDLVDLQDEELLRLSGFEGSASEALEDAGIGSVLPSEEKETPSDAS